MFARFQRPASAGRNRTRGEDMRKSKTISVLVVALALAGCVTQTSPIALGQDRYMLGVNARGGFSSNSQLLADSIQRAHDFCANMGKRAVIESTHTTGVQGWTPQDNQVTFACVAE